MGQISKNKIAIETTRKQTHPRDWTCLVYLNSEDVLKSTHRTVHVYI